MLESHYLYLRCYCYWFKSTSFIIVTYQMFIFVFFQVSFPKTNQWDLGVCIHMLKKRIYVNVCIHVSCWKSTAHGDTSGKYLEAEVVAVRQWEGGDVQRGHMPSEAAIHPLHAGIWSGHLILLRGRLWSYALSPLTQNISFNQRTSSHMTVCECVFQLLCVYVEGQSELERLELGQQEAEYLFFRRNDSR